MELVKVWIYLFLLVPRGLVSAQQGKALCFTSTGHAFKFAFRFDRGSDTTITGLVFYRSDLTHISFLDTTIDSPGQCKDDVVDSNGILEVGLNVEATGQLPCGITKAGDNYTITVASIGNTTHVYRFQCVTGAANNLQPSKLTISDFETGNIEDRVALRNKPKNLRLQVVQADGNGVPALRALLGRLLKLRVVYDKVYQNVPDHWGSLFHIAFLEHDNADISLYIVTRGLGTVVKVTGSLPGSEFLAVRAVIRNTQTRIRIPDAYRQVSTGTAWTTSQRAVKVEAAVPGDFVAVKVVSINRVPAGGVRPAGSYMALPDDVLGHRYNCYTGTLDQPGGQALVYGVQSPTTVTIKFNSFDITGITINGNPVTTTTDVNLSENDVLYIQCGVNCKVITIRSDRPVGVVTGHDNQKVDPTFVLSDHIVAQFPPVSTYGSKFVLLRGFLHFIILEDPSSTVDMVRPSGSVPNVPSGTLITITSGTDEEIVFTNQKVMMLWILRDGFHPVSTPLLAEHQWVNHYYVVMEAGEQYALVVVTDAQDVEIRDRNNLMGFGTAVKVVDVAFLSRPVLQGPRVYIGHTVLTNTIVGNGMVEVVSGDRNTFMLITYPVNFRLGYRGYMAIGSSFSAFNPCVASPVVNTSFGSAHSSVPGDVIDNDCDGKTDEELNDGQDNDGDGRIDEDLVSAEPDENVGIYVRTLKVSNTAEFSNSFDLITDGCSVRSERSAVAIQPFSPNAYINEWLVNLYVVETPPFRAFYVRSPRVYFQAEVGFCYGNLSGTRCQMSCTGGSGRRRREADEIFSLQTNFLLDVNTTDSNTGDQSLCKRNGLYWIPPILLLLTILIEATTIASFVFIRSKLINNCKS